MVYSAISHLVSDKNAEKINSLDAAKRWTIATRNVSLVFKEEFKKIEKDFSIDYDVDSWYIKRDKKLMEYNSKTDYIIEFDQDRLKSILEESKRLYGDDTQYRVGKILTNWRIKDFFFKAVKL